MFGRKAKYKISFTDEELRFVLEWLLECRNRLLKKNFDVTDINDLILKVTKKMR